jgi:lipopolysaccharide/colanic/teichoic acid biosynthesis glycosyltransferase
MEGNVGSVPRQAVDFCLSTLEETMDASESIHLAVHTPLTKFPLDSWRYRYVKRMFDLLCSIVLIVVFAIPGLLIAAAILLTSRGPIFYREQRIGLGGRPFRIWKFRTMHRNAAQMRHTAHAQSDGVVLEWRMRKHLHHDPRVTASGRYLRRWSLDELPQLFNVVCGEMSLIGPRPIIEAETVFYGDLLGFYLAATPGISGLWQVSGRSNLNYDERAKLDASYVQSWSLGTDARVCLLTLPAVMSRIGAR